MFIDTHCHAGKNWFEPIENLIFQMDNNSIVKAVLIQHKGSTNDYLFECLKRFPNKFSVIPALKWNMPLSVQLNEFKKSGASGVRIYLDYPEIFDNKGDDLFKSCAEKKLVISLASNLETFSSENFNKLLERNKETIFIIEHLAGAKNINEDNNKFKDVLNLSKNDNLYMKIPGLGEIYNRPEFLDKKYPFDGFDSMMIKEAIKFFGSKKLMWGSDYPPVSNREGYKNAFDGIYNLEFIDEKEKKDIFFNVPEKLFF